MNTSTNETKNELDKFRRTKIIATVGPSVNDYDSILELIKSGANALRLNFSHGTLDEKSNQIKWIRKAAKSLGHKPVAIIQDLQGPKIRLGDFDDQIKVKSGQILNFKFQKEKTSEEYIPIQYDLSKKVKKGERLFLYDGKIRTEITEVKNGIVKAKAQNDGILVKRKGINLPDTNFGGDIITDKDKNDIKFGATQDIDYVALSFVQTAEDIINIRKMLEKLSSSAKIIAKIETKAAVENIEEIIKACDVIMIARGDLAVETLPESVPIVQRQIIGLGQNYAKPTIVATQMLGTMTENPEPSRAEVSDVATAVIIGADCVMLSDETASGNYPIESVSMMGRVIDYAEANLPVKVSFLDKKEDRSQEASISKAVINLAENINARAIVAETKSGATVKKIASLRPEVAIIGVASDDRTAQQLSIVYGAISYVRPVDPMAAQKLTDWLRSHKLFEKGDIVVTTSGKYPGMVGSTDTIKVRVLD